MMLAFSQKEYNNLRAVMRHVLLKYARRSLRCNSYSIGEVFSGSTGSWPAFERPFVPPFQAVFSLCPNSLLGGLTPVRRTAAAGARVSLSRQGCMRRSTFPLAFECSRRGPRSGGGWLPSRRCLPLLVIVLRLNPHLFRGLPGAFSFWGRWQLNAGAPGF
jgi:hypothetical protein